MKLPNIKKTYDLNLIFISKKIKLYKKNQELEKDWNKIRNDIRNNKTKRLLNFSTYLSLRKKAYYTQNGTYFINCQLGFPLKGRVGFSCYFVISCFSF